VSKPPTLPGRDALVLFIARLLTSLRRGPK
jgi:hypothetical protein